jgi:hypothetical protein
MQAFLMDGVAYNVRVSKMTRSFSVQDTDKTGRTQDGEMYRDIVGTFYNYSMEVAQMDNDRESFDSFWEAISQPVESHVCEFPYNQTVMTQKMYITSGEQDLISKTFERSLWGAISLNYIAMSPKVVP